jgi:hypothetical protein
MMLGANRLQAGVCLKMEFGICYAKAIGTADKLPKAIYRLFNISAL